MYKKSMKGGNAISYPSEFYGGNSNNYYLNPDNNPLSAYGTVVPVSHGTIRGEVSGPNLAVYPSIGGQQTGGSSCGYRKEQPQTGGSSCGYRKEQPQTGGGCGPGCGARCGQGKEQPQPGGGWADWTGSKGQKGGSYVKSGASKLLSQIVQSAGGGGCRGSV